jgi:hypothetical protein
MDDQSIDRLVRMELNEFMYNRNRTLIAYTTHPELVQEYLDAFGEYANLMPDVIQGSNFDNRNPKADREFLIKFCSEGLQSDLERTQPLVYSALQRCNRAAAALGKVVRDEIRANYD